MTVEKRIDQMVLMVGRLDEKNNIHPEEIRYAMSDAFAQLMGVLLEKNDIRSLDYFAKEYTSQLCVQNASTLRYEITLPAQILHLPKNGLNEAIRNVNYNAGEDLSFIQVSMTDYELMYNQDVYLVDDSIRFTVDTSKIIFLNGIDADNEDTFTSTGLRLRLIVGLDAYGYTDMFPVPKSMDYDFNMMTLQFLGLKPPAELLNRNQ
ncbi:MAG: hypothetical protein WC343_12520 [Bacilli bacterium]|jgi:hypothetical protein